MAVERTNERTDQPSPEEQRRQQEAQLRGAPLPGRGAAGPTDESADEAAPMDSAMGGAGDTDSGAGNAAGTPDGDTALRAGEAVTRGDVRQDREKVFPEANRDAKGPDAGDEKRRR